MLISCSVLGTSALETPYGNEHLEIGLSLSSDTVSPGDEVTVTLNILNNYNAVTMFWPVLFSSDFFELVGEDGGLTKGIDTVTSPVGRTSSSLNDAFVPEGIEGYSAYAIQWIAGVQGSVAEGNVLVGAFSSAEAVECFSFKLRVKDGATGSGTVLIPQTSDRFVYAGIKDVNDATTSYASGTPFDFVIGEPQVCSIGAAADPEIVAAEGYNVKVRTFPDDETEYLVGFNAYEITEGESEMADQFTVENGYCEIDGDFATGTEVNVYYPDGTLYKTYVIIFFGDCTGDGGIDGMDITYVVSLMTYDHEMGDVYGYAADVFVEDDDDCNVDGLDLTTVVNVITYDIELSDVTTDHYLT